MKKVPTIVADIGLLYAAAIWGSTFFVVKAILDDINPVTLVAYRFLIAAGILLAILLIFKKKPFHMFGRGLVLGIILWLLYVPQTIGLEITTASNSGFITGLFVAFVPLFSIFFFRKKPSVMGWIAVAVSLAGLLVLTNGLVDINWGDVITLLAAMTYAAHILIVDKYAKEGIDPYVVNFQQILVVGVLSLIAIFALGIDASFSKSATLWILIFLAIFPTITAFLIQVSAQRFTAPVKVSLIFALEPVFAAAFAWTLGGEGFVIHRALGGLLIFIAIAIADLPLPGRWGKRSV